MKINFPSIAEIRDHIPLALMTVRDLSFSPCLAYLQSPSYKVVSLSPNLIWEI